MLRQTTAVLVALAAFITSQIVLLALALCRLTLAGATNTLLIKAIFSILVLIVLDSTFVGSGFAVGVANQ